MLKDVNAIDVRMIESSGIGTYIRNQMGQGIYHVALGDEKIIRKYDKEVKVIPFSEKIYGIKEQIKFPYKELKKLGVTKLHCPHYNIPLFYRGELIVTIHDLIHLQFPQYLPNKWAHFYARFMLELAVRKAKKILTVSEYTKTDLIKLLHAKSKKICVVYNAIEDGFRIEEEEEYSYLYQEYKIRKNEKILLYVGNIKPHKNLERLVEAYSQLTIPNTKLIIVGKEFDNQKLYKEVVRAKLEDKLVFTGVVSHKKLVDLYNLADAFVFPSLYEGFGIPPLEAMACGTVVICSNAASLPEVIGDAAIMFDPENIEEIKNQIQKGLRMSNEEQNEIVQKGLRNSEKFNRLLFLGHIKQLVCGGD